MVGLLFTDYLIALAPRVTFLALLLLVDCTNMTLLRKEKCFTLLSPGTQYISYPLLCKQIFSVGGSTMLTVLIALFIRQATVVN